MLMSVIFDIEMNKIQNVYLMENEQKHTNNLMVVYRAK